jgi:hypothetical protein
MIRMAGATHHIGCLTQLCKMNGVVQRVDMLRCLSFPWSRNTTEPTRPPIAMTVAASIAPKYRLVCLVRRSDWIRPWIVASPYFGSSILKQAVDRHRVLFFHLKPEGGCSTSACHAVATTTGRELVQVTTRWPAAPLSTGTGTLLMA